jgi:hypothetical protein
MSDAAHKMTSATTRELDMRPLQGRMTPPRVEGDGNWKLADHLVTDNLLTSYPPGRPVKGQAGTRALRTGRSLLTGWASRPLTRVVSADVKASRSSSGRASRTSR